MCAATDIWMPVKRFDQSSRMSTQVDALGAHPLRDCIGETMATGHRIIFNDQKPNGFHVRLFLWLRGSRQSHQGEPELSEAFQSLGELFHINRLGNEAVGLEFVTSPNILLVF